MGRSRRLPSAQLAGGPSARTLVRCAASERRRRVGRPVPRGFVRTRGGVHRRQRRRRTRRQPFSRVDPGGCGHVLPRRPLPCRPRDVCDNWTAGLRHCTRKRKRRASDGPSEFLDLDVVFSQRVADLACTSPEEPRGLCLNPARRLHGPNQLPALIQVARLRRGRRGRRRRLEAPVRRLTVRPLLTHERFGDTRPSGCVALGGRGAGVRAIGNGT